MSDEPIAFLLSQATRRWRRLLDLELRQEGVTYSTWVTLAYMQQGGDGMLQKDLARLMAIEAPTLVRLLDRLERNGLVDRRPSPGDRRGKTVHLTAAARRVLARFNEIAAGVRTRMLQGIREQDIAICHDVVSQIIDNASALDAPAE
jgi:MarR family transcriptional regulator, transcriptional regulator for hemolysin